jgi:hypothetical protein
MYVHLSSVPDGVTDAVYRRDPQGPKIDSRNRTSPL